VIGIGDRDHFETAGGTQVPSAVQRTRGGLAELEALRLAADTIRAENSGVASSIEDKDPA
jgi:hypothetical protein